MKTYQVYFQKGNGFGVCETLGGNWLAPVAHFWKSATSAHTRMMSILDEDRAAGVQSDYSGGTMVFPKTKSYGQRVIANKRGISATLLRAIGISPERRESRMLLTAIRDRRGLACAIADEFGVDLGALRTAARRCLA
jgi:hypothetical protein